MFLGSVVFQSVYSMDCPCPNGPGDYGRVFVQMSRHGMRTVAQVMREDGKIEWSDNIQPDYDYSGDTSWVEEIRKRDEEESKEQALEKKRARLAWMQVPVDNVRRLHPSDCLALDDGRAYKPSLQEEPHEEPVKFLPVRGKNGLCDALKDLHKKKNPSKHSPDAPKVPRDQSQEGENSFVQVLQRSLQEEDSDDSENSGSWDDFWASFCCSKLINRSKGH